jgi:thioredoxin-related protein
MDGRRNTLSACLLASSLFFNGILAPDSASAETVLVMAEEEGCIWCAAWNRDVATEYPITAEGRAAPLRRVDARSLPDDLVFEKSVRYTPTFVLMQDGREVSRLEGYPGEDFFWGLLQKMLNEAGIELTAEN